MTKITFTKRPNSKAWECDQCPNFVIWLPCDKKTYRIMNWPKGGWPMPATDRTFRKLENAQKHLAANLAL